MNPIEKAIKDVLPSLAPALLEEVAGHLCKESGVDVIADLRFVEEGDLAPFLRPIQCRKLLHAWNTTDTPEPEGPATPPRTPLGAVQNRTPPSTPGPSAPLLSPSPIDSAWSNRFEVPWSQMPSGIKRAIGQRRRPLPADQKELVQIVVKDMMAIHPNPTRAQTSVIARKIVCQHPDSFEDRSDDGERLGCGFNSLLEQMKTRIAYKNRGKIENRLRRPRRKLGDEGQTGVVQADVYGCIQWQPTDLPEGETEETLENKRLAMIELFKRDGPKAREKLDDLMKSTYYLQRKTINGKPSLSVTEIQTKWPYLFYQRWMCTHFKLLTGVSVFTKMSEALGKEGVKGGRIRRFMASLGHSAKKSVREIIANYEKASDQTQADHDSDLHSAATMLLMMAELDEKPEALFMIADVTDTNAEIEAKLDLPDTPRVIVLGESILTGNQWKVSIEGRVAMTVARSGSFISALSVVFAAYYVLNLQYEEEAATTLEFIQRYFLCINPETGSKCPPKKRSKSGKVVQRKQEGISSRITTFCRKMSDFEWKCD